MKKSGNSVSGPARAIAIAAAIAVICALAGIGALIVAASPSDRMGAGSLFTVEHGESAYDIAKSLEDRGLIRSALAFRLISKLEGVGSSLKAGTYRIGPDMGPRRILNEFASGNQALCKVTIPEGFTLSQLAGLLERNGVAKRADFLAAAHSPALLGQLGIAADSAEGYLFPDTYFFPAGYSAEGVIRSMVQTFRERVATIPEASSSRQRSFTSGRSSRRSSSENTNLPRKPR